MRLAFVDLLFAWPPHGGACTDLYETVAGLQRLGHETHLFAASHDTTWERGSFEPAELPFPATAVEFRGREFNRREVPRRLQAAVDAWRPEAVFVTDGFFLKPYVIDALAHYPLAVRYYAYEAACPRDFRLFKHAAQCPHGYLRTPDTCRRCTLEGIGGELRRGRLSPWTQEYLAARAFLPGYHRRLLAALGQARAVIVYNDLQRRQLETVHPNVRVVPGGVDPGRFEAAPPPDSADKRTILMAGRAEDPAKGFAVLREAAARLARERSDFVVCVTHPDRGIETETLRCAGWRDHRGMAELYRQADVCVVPSVWDEPFGLVALEAMAVGRPVVASRVGGLQHIVVEGETGFLFERGNAGELAERLSRLLDDPELRRRMGERARRRVEEEYDWQRIVERYYPRILEDLAR